MCATENEVRPAFTTRRDICATTNWARINAPTAILLYQHRHRDLLVVEMKLPPKHEAKYDMI